MSNLLQLQNGTKAYATRALFEEASFAINAGEHVGVIGPNGAGKTTLFKILTGQESLDSGKLIQSRNLRIGYLAQHDLWEPGTLVEDFLSTGTHLPIWELKSLGRGLGLQDAHYGQSLDSLSGGYRTRIKLLHLLGQEPDLLLLDEPTNYLDLESVIVLETFLQESRGAFLLVSHDREFLRRTTDHILEVEGGDITKFNGNLDDYFEQKEMLRAQLEARALSQQEKRQSIMDFVNRFGAKATKARQAQSRLKTLAKMENIEVKALPNTAKILIPPPKACGKVVLALKNLTLGYPQKTILREVTLNLERGDHLAVVGVNGAGKTTLLKALAGALKPLTGEITFGYEVTMGYYAQHVAENLRPEDTVLEAMSSRIHPEVTSQQILNLAGSLLFSGDAMKKKISVLSGGEKSRVALGQILLQRAPFLVLDEPTNHLDFQTVEALTEALCQFEGTVVVVSHDRSFIRRVGTKILEVQGGRAELYPGTYEEYVWSIQKGVLSKNRVSDEIVRKAEPKTVDKVQPDRKVVERQLKAVERDLLRIEKQTGALQERIQLLQNSLSESPQSPELKNWLHELAEASSKLETAENEWLILSSKRESLLI